MERIVHVCNGDSTADTLSLADLPGEIRVWADALDRGPVLPVADGWVMQLFCDHRVMQDVAPTLRAVSREMPVIVDHV